MLLSNRFAQIQFITAGICILTVLWILTKCFHHHPKSLYEFDPVDRYITVVVHSIEKKILKAGGNSSTTSNYTAALSFFSVVVTLASHVSKVQVAADADFLKAIKSKYQPILPDGFLSASITLSSGSKDSLGSSVENPQPQWNRNCPSFYSTAMFIHIKHMYAIIEKNARLDEYVTEVCNTLFPNSTQVYAFIDKYTIFRTCMFGEASHLWLQMSPTISSIP